MEECSSYEFHERSQIEIDSYSFGKETISLINRLDKSPDENFTHETPLQEKKLLQQEYRYQTNQFFRQQISIHQAYQTLEQHLKALNEQLHSPCLELNQLEKFQRSSEIFSIKKKQSQLEQKVVEARAVQMGYILAAKAPWSIILYQSIKN